MEALAKRFTDFRLSESGAKKAVEMITGPENMVETLRLSRDVSIKLFTIFSSARAIGLIKHPIFPDQTKIFLQKAEDCIKESLEVDMKIVAPLIDLDKKEVYALSEHYELPIKDTYYCHNGDSVPCGKCVACLEHMEIINILKKEFD